MFQILTELKTIVKTLSCRLLTAYKLYAKLNVKLKTPVAEV